MLKIRNLKIKGIPLLIVNLILLIGISNIVSAVDVGIVVEFNDGTVKTDCVDVPQETEGFAILEKSVFDILWSPSSAFGQLVCKIDNEGTGIQGNFCEFSGEFWNFNILPNGDSQWLHSPVGHNGPGGCWNRKTTSFAGHYCGIDKDVLGYKFDSGSDGEPKLKTYADVCEKLKIKDIKVYVDGKKESGADEAGGKIDVIPGSKLDLKIEIENLYTKKEDIGIEEISVQGTLEGIDDGRDIDGSANDFDLSAGKNKEITLEFSIPLKVEDGDYDLIVEIEGENERGFPYSKIIEFEVDVEKEKHDVAFKELGFSSSNIQCGNAAKLNVNVVNLGTSGEDVKLIITNRDLGIDIMESFKLSRDPFEKGNSFRKSYIVDLPQNTLPGKYMFLADSVFGDNAERSNAELNVECSNFVESEKEENTIAQVTGHVSGLKLKSKSQELSQQPGIENENSFYGKPLVISLAIFAAITLIAIVALLLYLLKI